jgi:hypothetical protein
MEEHCENCVYARFLYGRLQACARDQDRYVDAYYWCPCWRPLIFEDVGLFGQLEANEVN